MQVKCEYCGSMIDDTLEKCPNCGAPNEHMKRMVNGTPKTIAELADWYKARKLPPYETTRFFIGIDYKEPRAFGIYEENGEFIVYKNKDDGSRAIRYQGKDEAYAVNEIYLKLKSEILNQKARNQSMSNSSRSFSSRGGKRPERGSGWGFGAIILGIILINNIGRFFLPMLAAVLVGFVVYKLMSKILKINKSSYSSAPKSSKVILWVATICLALTAFSVVGKLNGPKYYKYNDTTYVSYHGDNYYYDDSWDDYSYIDALPVEIQNNPADYDYNWTDSSWDSGYNFYNSETYESEYNPSDSSSDWSSDSDYDWDSGSDWDSGGSDWGSDW